ncbi:PH domain-containing protein [Candidatus Saccharibacteria bacterium]|nr:PH domain-containing protein [Candidatus Saccharibacteria bacterium]
MDESLANIRHERSKKDFPALKLEDGEYVEFAFSRAKICYLLIWGCVAGVAVLITALFMFLFMTQPEINTMGNNFLAFLVITIIAFAFIAGLIATKVFSCNKLFITNRRAIQFIMVSPVVTSKNVIDLSSIEDASFRQTSIIQKLFKIGTLRLSTVGDETTYTLQYVEVIGGDELNSITKLIRSNKNTKKDEDKEEA